VNGDDDPGWRPALRPWWHLFVPFVPIWLRRDRVDVIRLRHVYLHSGIALVELCLAVQWTLHDRPKRIPSIAWIAAGVIIAWEVVALIWSERTALSGGTAEELAARFRARSFIQLGLALAPGLYGIVGAQLLERPELSWLGALASVLLLAWVAPRKSRLDRIDEQLRVAGSSLTVRSALSETT
jgi:hypothetical protein